jgi:hypothetical protein
VTNCPELLAWRKAKEEGKLTAATLEGSTFCTYQINAVGVEGFGPTKVLLDNQANISIMRPDLLRLRRQLKDLLELMAWEVYNW